MVLDTKEVYQHLFHGEKTQAGTGGSQGNGSGARLARFAGMARKLKTFTTAIGFYDLAIAAPSMKAALDAWGARQNLFHEGLARETDDPDIVAATLEKPGVVLRRAVGTDQPFQEKAPPPSALPRTAPDHTKPRAKKRRAAPSPTAQKAAIIKFEDAKAKRDAAREREAAQQAATEKAEQARRVRQAAKAKAALTKGRARHDAALQKLERQREALDRKIDAERLKWRRAEKALLADIHAADV